MKTVSLHVIRSEDTNCITLRCKTDTETANLQRIRNIFIRNNGTTKKSIRWNMLIISPNIVISPKTCKGFGTFNTSCHPASQVQSMT